MFDGVVTTLTSVRYVPYLMKNLTSLGILNFLDYSYPGKDKVKKITQGTFGDNER
jgi:hypothetical protein